MRCCPERSTAPDQVTALAGLIATARSTEKEPRTFRERWKVETEKNHRQTRNHTAYWLQETSG